MVKRYKLRVNWSKDEGDLMIFFPLGIGTKSDGGYLASIFNNDFIDEMKSRGYDIENLKFEIPIKKGERLDKFITLNNDLDG